MKSKDNGVFVADDNACPGCGTILDHYTVDDVCSNCELAARRDDSEEEHEPVDNTDYPTQKADGFWDNYWFDAGGKPHAQDCPTCGGSGQCHAENGGRSLDYTCATCHGSGVVPTEGCPAWVAGLILADNQRRVFEADQDWNYAPEGDDEDEEGDDGRAHPVEPDDDEEYCPSCGGSGGDGYDSDYGVCGTCHGSGCVAKGWGEGDEEE